MAMSGPMGPTNQEICLRKFRPRLAEAMRDAGTDPGRLAKACDMTRPAITQYLDGIRLPNSVALVRLSRNLNRSCDWLLGVSDDPTPRD